MYELKTKQNETSVTEFLDNLSDLQKKKDSYKLLDLFKNVTGEEPMMWGSSIIGFGSCHYKYPSGQEGDWMLSGFSPRKQALTLYIMSGFEEFEEMLKKLGKHKTGKSCLYLNKLADVDMEILKEMIKKSVKTFAKRYA
jgi:hypothetical protein